MKSIYGASTTVNLQFASMNNHWRADLVRLLNILKMLSFQKRFGTKCQNVGSFILGPTTTESSSGREKEKTTPGSGEFKPVNNVKMNSSICIRCDNNNNF